MSVKLKNTSPAWVDPDDAPELTEEFFEKATLSVGDKLVSKKEFKKAAKTALRGRPPIPAPRKAINIRLSQDILYTFKATGKGWQTRVNDALRDWLKLHNPA